MSISNSSPASLVSEYTGQGNSFLFETLYTDSYKSISASNPVATFKSLEDLNLFLENNPEITEMKDAGFAGYISYEGDLCFGVYENIRVSSGNPSRHCEPQASQNCSAILLADSGEESDIQDKVYSGPREAIQEHAPPRNDVTYPNSNEYLEAVKKCQEYIYEGDIYQANIAHKFIIEDKRDPFKIYQSLRASNPSPYSGFMNLGDYQIISSSPESFLKISKQNDQWLISSSPIKGTIGLNQLGELLGSSKEKAEHIMIVDLIRNDLGRICKTGTIEVKELLGLYRFKNLYHFVSNIEGVLEELDFNKIFQACCPGGSITGTPKKRAMEVISELENSPRGPYTGTMGYFKFQEGGEFSILIRTIVLNKLTGELSFHSGAGITAGSNPENELAETMLKAEKILEIFHA